MHIILRPSRPNCCHVYVVTLWTCMLGVMGLKPGKVIKFFCLNPIASDFCSNIISLLICLVDVTHCRKDYVVTMVKTAV